MATEYEKEVTIGSQTYNVRALTARQMKTLSEFQQKGEDPTGHEGNYMSVSFSLNNYLKAHGEPERWTTEMVSDFPWPVYKQLNKEVAEVSGFDLVEPGNVPAASPQA